VFQNDICGMIGSVIPGAAAFEIAAHAELMKCKDMIKGRSRLGYLLFYLTMLDCRSFLNVDSHVFYLVLVLAWRHNILGVRLVIKSLCV